MGLSWLLAMQAATAGGAVSPHFDLAGLPRPPRDTEIVPRCKPGDSAEIVVCGRRERADEFEAAQRSRYANKGPFRAETSLGEGATGGIYVDSVAMPGGQVSKRLTVGVKVAF